MTRILGRTISGAIAGAAGWFTLGVIAIDGDHVPRQSFGLLPPIWLLGVMVVIGISVAVRFNRPSTLPLCGAGLVIVPWVIPPVAPLMLWTGAVPIVVWAIVAADGLRQVSAPTLAGSKVAVVVTIAL